MSHRCAGMQYTPIYTACNSFRRFGVEAAFALLRTSRVLIGGGDVFGALSRMLSEIEVGEAWSREVKVVADVRHRAPLASLAAADNQFCIGR